MQAQGWSWSQASAGAQGVWWCDHYDFLEEADECFATEDAMRAHQRAAHTDE